MEAVIRPMFTGTGLFHPNTFSERNIFRLKNPGETIQVRPIVITGYDCTVKKSGPALLVHPKNFPGGSI